MPTTSGYLNTTQSTIASSNFPMNMLGNGWLTIRQAQEALKNGRLEEAHRLLGQSAAQGHKRSWELLQQVAVGFVERGERHLRQNELEAAWNDLLLAEQVGLADDNNAGVRLRKALSQRGLDEVRVMLQAGDPARAAAALDLLQVRAVRHTDLELLRGAAADWLRAREQGDRGEFNMAILTVERVRQQLPNLTALERFEEDLTRRRESCKAGLIRLHEAMDQGQWRRVMEAADQVLAAAPQQAQARKARSQAWKAIEPPTVGEGELRPSQAPATVGKPADRFLLWIDGVGGYLVCLGNRVSIGQATPEAAVDVPFFADISRLHATVTRDAGTYLIEGARALQINGQDAEKAVLQAGDRMTLGSSCQLVFGQTVPVSATARLDIASGHRLSLAVDAVLLMADTLVLGVAGQVHVSIPDLKQNVILFRTKDGLGIRCPGVFHVDGQRCQDRTELKANSRVTIEDCVFAIESISGRLGAM